MKKRKREPEIQKARTQADLGDDKLPLEQRKALVYFDRLWRARALKGKNDESFGAEHRRVRQEWLDAGHPKNIADFLDRNVNTPPAPE